MTGYTATRLAWQVAGFAAIVAVVWAMTTIAPRWSTAIGASGRRAIGWVTASTRRAMLGLLVVALVLALAALACTGTPYPTFPDEFGYLLAADTFASGRLSNPTPPNWEHFEALQILVRPSYSAKTPPGQGLVLALGQVLTGWPFAGVLLVTVLVPAVTFWAFRGWTTPAWSLLGALLMLLHPLTREWGRSFAGGNHTVLGSLLVIGSLGRLLSAPRRRDGVLFGLGAVALVYSRPFEALVLVPSAIVPVLWKYGQASQDWRRAARRCVVPVVAVGLAGLAFLLLHNRAVTGSVLQLPVQAFDAQYQVSPVFVWQSPRPVPAFPQPDFKEFYARYDMEWYRHQQRDGLAAVTRVKALTYFWAAAEGLLLALPLAALPWLVFRARRLAVVTGLLALLSTAALCIVWCQSRYVAVALPFAVLASLLAASGAKLRVPRVGGLAAAWAAYALAGFVWLAVAQDVAIWRSGGLEFWPTRQRIEAELRAQPGKHVVFVKYSPAHPPGWEWVYNRANLQASRVIWVRDRTQPENGTLLAKYPGRAAWSLNADGKPVRLRPADADAQ